MPQTELRPIARGLDERTKVTHPSAWAALVAVLGVIVVGVVVAFRVHLPDTVTVPATVYYAGGQVAVSAIDDGIIHDVAGTVGTQVEQGQELLSVMGADGIITTYSAPTDGLLLELEVTIGQSVPRGSELARVTRPAATSTVSVIAYVSPDEAVHFEPGAAVEVLVDGAVVDATVTARADRRSNIESMSEVLGGPALAMAVFEDTGGSPIALSVSIANSGVTDGTNATIRRVVADPSVWDVLTGGGQ